MCCVYVFIILNPRFLTLMLFILPKYFCYLAVLSSQITSPPCFDQLWTPSFFPLAWLTDGSQLAETPPTMSR